MSEWKSVRLKDVASNASRAFDFRSKATAIFINTGDVLDGYFLHNELSDLRSLPGQAKKAIRKGDILYSEIRPGNGRHALVQQDLPDYVVSTKFMVLESKPGMLPEFLYHVLKSPECESEFKLIAESRSGTFPQITFDAVSHYEFQLPPLDEQRAIALILGTLDDKIELNRRTNETLEAMARAIFKSWFVDFDPVRAKASGEPPESICRRLGFSPDVLALFPDGFEEPLFGDIPLGWSMATLSDFSELNAKSWSAKTLPAQINYVDLANTKNGVIQDVQTFRKSEAPSRARRILRSGDTIIGTVRPGNKSFALVSPRDVQLTGSTGFAVLSPIEDYLTEIVYMAATAEENIERLARLADGGAYPAVSPEIVVATECVQPSVEVAKAFHHVVAPLKKMYDANTIEIDTLAGLRDSLLPKLLSGDLTPAELSGESE